MVCFNRRKQGYYLLQFAKVFPAKFLKLPIRQLQSVTMVLSRHRFKLSYFSGTLNLAIFVDKDLRYFYFSYVYQDTQ